MKISLKLDNKTTKFHGLLGFNFSDWFGWIYPGGSLHFHSSAMVFLDAYSPSTVTSDSINSVRMISHS